MHPTGSVIMTALERFRGLLDEVALDAKYSNDYIVRHILSPAYVDISSRLLQDADNPIVMRFNITTVANQEHYLLPPNIAQVLRIARTNTDGTVQWEWLPKSEYDVYGPNWALEDGVLALRPIPITADTVTLWYRPQPGEAPLSYGVCTVATTTTIEDFTPTLGYLDRRPNAYLGSNFRLLPPVQLIEDFTIASQDLSATPTFTLRTPIQAPYSFPTTPDILCEVAPQGFQSLIEPITYQALLRQCVARSVPASTLQNMRLLLQNSMKSLRDRFCNYQGRTGKSWQTATVDRSHTYYGPFGWM